MASSRSKGVKGTTQLPGWQKGRVAPEPAPSGKKGRALRLMAIRQARLERVALIASSHQRTINNRPAASGERTDLFLRRNRPFR